ncbi:hypothetical protein Tco_1471612 [Tanacetum coccineum]
MVMTRSGGNMGAKPLKSILKKSKALAADTCHNGGVLDAGNVTAGHSPIVATVDKVRSNVSIDDTTTVWEVPETDFPTPIKSVWRDEDEMNDVAGADGVAVPLPNGVQQVEEQVIDSGISGEKNVNAWDKPFIKPMHSDVNELGVSMQQKKTIDEVVEGAAVTIPLVAVEEILSFPIFYPGRNGKGS